MVKVVLRQDDPALNGFLTVTVNIGLLGNFSKLEFQSSETCRLAAQGARSMSQRKFVKRSCIYDVIELSSLPWIVAFTKREITK